MISLSGRSVFQNFVGGSDLIDRISWGLVYIFGSSRPDPSVLGGKDFPGHGGSGALQLQGSSRGAPLDYFPALGFPSSSSPSVFGDFVPVLRPRRLEAANFPSQIPRSPLVLPSRRRRSSPVWLAEERRTRLRRFSLPQLDSH